MNPLLVLSGSLILLALFLFFAFLDYSLVCCLYETLREREWTESFFYFLGFCMITGFLIFLLGTLLG